MSSNLYSIGLSGLQSSNARINTTGQNTSNVDTEGYSRQRTDTSSSPLGGVVLRDTSRLVDYFVSQQVRTDTSEYNYYDTYHSLMSVSDSLFAEDSVSLNTYLNKAFDALQAANNDPTSSSLRQLAFTSLSNLVDQYKTLSEIVTEQVDVVDGQLTSSLTELNSITEQISSLNGQILQQEGMSISPSNELRDQQELLAKELAQYLSIKTQFNDRGLMTIHLSDGQPLVMDQHPTELKIKPNPLNPQKINLAVDFGDYDVGVKTVGLGGSIGGLVDFRSEFSLEANRTLGQHAISIADAMNVQNSKGLDKNGGFGKDLFSLSEIQVHAAPSNKFRMSEIAVRVSAGESTKVQKGMYELTKTDDNRFAITTYDLNDESTGEAIYFDPSAMEANSNGYYKVEKLGIDVRLGDINKIGVGDLFRFSPTQGAASGLKLIARNGNEIALSAPIGVSTSSDNLSESKMSLSAITNTSPDTSAFARDGSLYPSAPHKIYFTSPSSYVVQDSTGVELAKVENVQHFSNLLEQAGLAKEAGFDVSVSSAPSRGDSFIMSPDEVGASDNFNGIALTELQNKSLVAGEASLTKAFAGFISYVGSKTSDLEGNVESSEVVMNQSIARRDRTSAVSLDEEAVNLLKYQQSYSASAQVITAARTTFETLLGIMR